MIKGPKDFLRPLTQFDVEEVITKPQKVRSWIPRLFSILGFFGMAFGATVLGLSFHKVGTNEVGYYNDEITIYDEGTYLELPWKDQKMQVVNIGPQQLEIENLSGHTKDATLYNIRSLSVRYSISDVDKYVEQVKTKGGCEKFTEWAKILVQNGAQAQLRNKTRDELVQDFTLPLLQDNDFGITVDETIFSTPVFPYNAPPQQDSSMADLIANFQRQLDELGRRNVVVNEATTMTTNTPPVTTG